MVESDDQLTVSVVSVLLFREQEAVGYRSSLVRVRLPELLMDSMYVPDHVTAS